MSITTEARSYADAAVEQGKVAVEQGIAALAQAGSAASAANKRLAADAPKPAFAVVGAADLVLETVTKRVEALPAEALANVTKAQESGKALLAKAQDEAASRIADLRGKLEAGVGTLKALPETSAETAKSTREATVATREAYLAAAKDVYAQLARRGVTRITDLRKDPRLTRVLGQVDVLTDKVEAAVAPETVAVQTFFEPVPSATPARKAPRKAAGAKSAATRRTEAASGAPRKTTPRKASTTVAPRKNAAAKITAAKATATKATRAPRKSSTSA